MRKLWPEERRELSCASGYVREVILSIDGLAVAWVRSATCSLGIKGPWKILRGQDAHSLNEKIFQDARITRTLSLKSSVSRTGRVGTRLRAAWKEAHSAFQSTPDGPRWARSSVFKRRGAALRVMEVFAPCIARLDARAQRTLAAYKETRYEVCIEPAFSLVVGKPLDERALARKVQSPPGCAVITAYNPDSRLLTDKENLVLHNQLGEVLARENRSTLPAQAVHPAGLWPIERGFLVTSITLKDALRLAQAFAQCAIIWCPSGQLPRVVLISIPATR